MKKVSRKGASNQSLYERQAIVCKAFANPTRLHLLDLLGKGEIGAGTLQERLGISKANLSQHLSILRSAGVVNTRREGKRLLAELSSPQIKEACHHMRNILKLQGRTQRSA
jgi:DNA-binding transcriptional ArsR family regulator